MLDPALHSFEKTKKIDLNLIEIFVSVYLNSLSDDHRTQTIPYETAVEMMLMITEIVSNAPLTSDVKKGAANIFDQDKKEISCDFFYSTFRDNFENGRHALRDGLRALFHNQKSTLPDFDSSQASLLEANILALIKMSTNRLPQKGSIQCLYNSLKSGSSFNRLSFALIGYTAPSLLLIRHTYQTTEGQTLKGLIGAVVTTDWKEELGYWGDSGIFLFTILPKIRFLYAYKGKGGSNFVYLNTKRITNSKFKVGLGFGGQEYRNFRLWLDDEILDKSSTYFNDDTYPMQALNEGYEETLKVRAIDVDRLH